MLLFFLTGLSFEIKRIIIAFWAFVKREIENILRNFGMGRYGLPRARCALAMTPHKGVRHKPGGRTEASAPTDGLLVVPCAAGHMGPALQPFL